ncbi:hypothetical protein NL676_014111 [Syzygium grande]|nr:hypothetical protein NL676_014111 [Syzygium grande]
MQKTPKGEDVHENSFVQRQQQTSWSGAVSWCRCLLGEIVDRDGKLQHPTSSPLRYTLPCASEFQSRPLFAAIAYSHCRVSMAVLSGPPTVLRGDSSTTIHASANMFV